MLQDLLNLKFNKNNIPKLECCSYLKLLLYVYLVLYSNEMIAQNKIELYMGTQINKSLISTNNLNITNKAKSLTTVSPLLGLNYKLKNYTFGFEFEYFRINYTNEFRYKDKANYNNVISNYKSKLLQLTIFTKHTLLAFKKSNFNLVPMFNLTNNQTPYDERTLIYGPNTYEFHSQTKANLGYFYSLSLGLEYKYRISDRYGFFIITQINSNFNRTLVEENNTIAYPDQTLAYQFLKVNGKGIGVNFGLSYNLSKINKTNN